MKIHLVQASFALTLSLMTGCGGSDDAETTGGGGSPAGAGGAGGGAVTVTAGTGGTGGGSATVSAYGAVTDYQLVDDQVALEGVEVCLYDHPEVPCVSTNATGEFVLAGVPANAEVAVVYSKADYITGVAPVTSGATDFKHEWQLVHKSTMEALYQAAGKTWTPGKAMVVFWAYDGANVSGASFAMQPAPAEAPIYTSAEGAPDLSLTATTSFGGGGFINVEPGEAIVTVTHPTLTCKSGPLRWAAANGGSRLPLVADAETSLNIECE